MVNLASWLLAVSVPVVKKVMVALGIGTISYASIKPLIDSILGNLLTTYASFTGPAAQILSLSGIPDALGIVTGAIVARVSFIVMNKIGKITA